MDTRFKLPKRFKLLLLAGTLAFGAAACATLGTSFQFPGPGSVTVGKTDKAALLAEFGQPMRVGYENGAEKWAYAYYHYSVFGASEVKNLDVVFDKKGVVASYSYESSVPSEVKDQLPAGN